MNRTIAEKQHQPDGERLFKAFSWHYDRAKLWRGFSVLGNIGLAAASPVFALCFPASAKWLAAAAGLWLLVSQFPVESIERGHREDGAKIHEIFDRNLFDLDWNYAVAGRPPAEEDIADAASRFRGKPARLTDWYPNTHKADHPMDVFLCQRSSAVWGRRDHTAYARFLVGITAGWFLVGLATAVIAGLSVENYLIALFLPSQPAFVEGIRLIQNHFKQARRKGNLEQRLDDLLEQLIAKKAVRQQESGMIQEQLFEYRRDGQYVPTLFYRLRRLRSELGMQQAVNEYLRRAHKI